MAGGFGAFGKMPSAGDFFRLNPPAGFVSAWDGWVQQAMLETQVALGPDWDGRYMSAPIWRFTLSPGLAGPQPAMGVLMPSVDRVGRRFPLTLMAAQPTAGSAAGAAADHLRAGPVFVALEDLALAALDDGMTRERLEQGLAGIAPPPAAAAVPLRQAAGCLILGGGGPASLAVDLPADLAGGLLAGRYTVPSVWSAEFAAGPRLMICEGLPGPAQARALFDPSAPLWEAAG